MNFVSVTVKDCVLDETTKKPLKEEYFNMTQEPHERRVNYTVSSVVIFM